MRRTLDPLANADGYREAADLHWLAFLLTGSCEVSFNVVVQALSSEDGDNVFFSRWMISWSRRVVIAKALNAIREEMAASVRRTESQPVEKERIPRTWSLSRDAGKAELEQALLTMDLFPRAVVLLSIFERLPIEDTALLLNTTTDLVRRTQAVGLRRLASNLARMQGWTPAVTALEPQWQPA
jgi:hypothetical protein